MTKKISQLPAATSVDTNDEFVINQDGTTKKLTTANQWDFANVNIDGGTIDGTAVNATTLTASGDALIGITTLPADLVHGRAVVASSATGGDFVAYKPTNVNVGDRCGAFVIGNNDTDGAEPHYVGMWGKAASTNGSMDLHFAAGRAGYEGDAPEMTLASGGNVGIGTSSPVVKLDVNAGTGNVGIVTRSTDAGSYISFVDNTTTNESSVFNGAVGNDFVISAGATERMRIDSSGHAIIPAGVTLGTSAGVYNAANTLDDYETGTWTPSFAAIANCSSITLSQAIYTKIGKFVSYHIQGNINITSANQRAIFTFTNAFAQSSFGEPQGGSAIIRGSSGEFAAATVIDASGGTSVAFVAVGASALDFNGSGFFDVSGSFRAG